MRLLSAISALLVTGVLAFPAAALDAGDGRREGRDGRGVDRESAAAIARQATGGRVLGIHNGRDDGGDYRVRVLTPDGTVRTLQIDRRSGRLRD